MVPLPRAGCCAIRLFCVAAALDMNDFLCERILMGGFDHGSYVFNWDTGWDIATRHEQVSCGRLRFSDGLTASLGDTLRCLFLHYCDRVHVSGECDSAIEQTASLAEVNLVIHGHDIGAGRRNQIETIGSVATDVYDQPDAARLHL